MPTAWCQAHKEHNIFKPVLQFQTSVNSINRPPLPRPLLGFNPSSHQHPTVQSSGAGYLLTPQPFPLLLSHQDQEPEAEPQGLEPAGKWVLCNYDFQARNSSELSVKQWDILEVRGVGDGVWGWGVGVHPALATDTASEPFPLPGPG